jgi:uncharacterized protein (DUF362 family)
MNVFLESVTAYEPVDVDSVISHWSELFRLNIRPGDRVVLKPNWLAHSHKYVQNEWQSVITHPSVITAVLKQVLTCLNGKGEVVITDAPQTDSQFAKIMDRMTPRLWEEMGRQAGVPITILDLREDEWVNEGDITVSRKKLPGDPKGSTECDLGNISSFTNHHVSSLGYYGADYNKAETNEAHSHGHHKYRVSRTVMEADVFINLPKLKTHKKAGITCSLKNLVGINTYKNYLPHHNEGTPQEGGDQFSESNSKNRTEIMLMSQIKRFLFNNPQFGALFVPVKKIGKKIFGDTRDVVRSGNWYGNNTLWRMVLDLNRVLLYSNPDGSLRPDQPESRKRYISIVDGIIAGEGNGPESPAPKQANVLIAGDNPVAVDAVCAKLMGFDWQKIPSLKNAFNLSSYKLIDEQYEDIKVESIDPRFNKKLSAIDLQDVHRFKPHFGWIGHLEISE